MASLRYRVAVLCFMIGQQLSTTLAQNSSANSQCSNPPPGLQKMVSGVDISRLDLVPLDAASNNGFKSPVISLTCSEGKTWRSPKGKEYQLPDQIWHLTTVPGGWLSADVSLYKSYEEVRDSLAVEVGIEGAIKSFSFSASTSYKKMQASITNSSRYISDVGAFESATTADLAPSWVLGLDKFTQSFVDTSLSGTFESNPSGYNKFINLFGTHYFAKANFGGYIRVFIETKTDSFYTFSENEIKVNAKASYLSVVSVQTGVTTGSTKVDETFKSSSTQSVRYYGGNTNLLTSGGISQWQPTVESDPWLYSGELKPISDLIKDATKRASMEKAVETYILRNYLDELERLLATGRSKWDDPILNSLQSRITNLKSKAVLDQKEVGDLGREVGYHIVVPEWFISRTNLCFKWRADDDAGQCGGGAANLLCAKPNSMTPVYRDDTDKRWGGCRMQWSIQSSGYASWFNDVKVCFRWYGDDDVGQCGGGAAPLLCAPINEFSAEYRDDTDDRSGGCRMSWKIDVPTTAPLWMRTTKMCFSWYPDDDAGQCGWIASRDLCAVANQWTEYYRDDTDWRWGGCRMSWGLRNVF